MNMHIVYEDNHILILKKDFMFSMSHLDEQVKAYLESKKEKVGYVKRLFNLDSLASGLVCYVLTSKAFERLEKTEFYYKFLAVSVGKPQNASGYFNANVEDLGNEKLGIAPPIKNSFNVNFYYKLLETKSQISLVECGQNTPNCSAVRFGLSEIGAPVFGDKLYRGDALAENTNLALVLFELTFEHPTTHNKMVFRCSPIEDAKPWAYFDLNKIYKN